MWKCEACKKKSDDKTTAIEVRFGKLGSRETQQKKEQYDAFYTESAWAPLCDDCAIAYIKGEIG